MLCSPGTTQVEIAMREDGGQAGGLSAAHAALEGSTSAAAGALSGCQAELQSLPLLAAGILMC